MTSPRQTAALVMDNIPPLMRVLRTKFREKRTGSISLVQFRTLAFVDANQGASLSDAAGYTGLSLPSMSKLVEMLVSHDLIKREMHGEDRRRICLSITEKGKRDLDEAYLNTQTYFAEKFAELTETDREDIATSINLLKKLFMLDTKARIPESNKEETVPV